MATATKSTAGVSSCDDQELLAAGNPLAAYISINPARMHGAPVFRGTRVPIQSLFDHVRAGDSFEKFLAGFSNVTREQVVGVIDLAFRGLLDGLPRS